MSSTLLIHELTHLASEAKKKHTELRNAAEKSLHELKALPVTSEQQLAADLSRRPAFIEPFLIASATRNVKFAASGVTCLQRLIISKGLPRARLKDALEAFNECTNLGLEIQLKILQALPSLLQNYSEDLKGDLLSNALEICASLQSAKAQTVSGVSAATLQQLITSIFEKVAHEDRNEANTPAVNEVETEDSLIRIKPAAFDAYRVFLDLTLAAEGEDTRFVRLISLSQESILELIWTSINTKPQLFAAHAELSSILRSNLLPLVTYTLSEKLGFGVTLRYLRILDLILGRCITQNPADCEVVMGLLAHTLEPDAAPAWKRALVMEILRNFFSEDGHVIDAYSAYDMKDGGRPIIQDLMSMFVRISSEKPSLIGLSQQSTVPAGPGANKEQTNETSLAEATGGMASIISTTLGVTEVNGAGISSRWSIPRTPYLEQLDKYDHPQVPETYVYALILECMGSLSDGLAKVVLPLTVHKEKAKSKTHPIHNVANGQTTEERSTVGRTRSHSYLQRSVPLNPLDQVNAETHQRVRAVDALVQSCWPAVLATSSTFLNAALDDQYYRNLIKAYQRFAQVAGLLRLSTARDALMTTLGKAAIPPQVVNAALAEPLKPATTDSPRVFSNPKSLLTVDGLMTSASTLSGERDRSKSVESTRSMLTTRNLLCLRALLNLAIALGPTLEAAFAVIVDTLRQADLVLSTTTPQQMIRQGLEASQRSSDPQSVVQAFSNEVAAVEAAATRLLETTADYPNGPFINILTTFCRLLHATDPDTLPSPSKDHAASPPPTPSLVSRSFSGFAGQINPIDMQMRNYKFAIPRLGNLAELNVSRFALGDPNDTGWNILIDELLALTSDKSIPLDGRRSATGVLCKLAAEVVAEVTEDDMQTRIAIQRRTFAVLLRLIERFYSGDGELTSSDLDLQGYVLDALQAILERCGESLVAGWNRIVAILSTAFERAAAPSRGHDDEAVRIDWEHISKGLVAVQLGRTAFAATQLICSDFLSALPTAAVPSLIELLYRFAAQSHDLNISFSTITMAWNVSDFLLSKSSSDNLENAALQVKEADTYEEGVQAEITRSTSSQWLLLLLRLRDIIHGGHKEVRKAAFQTVCSIFKNNGMKLSGPTWDLVLRSIIFKIAFNDVCLYHERTEDSDAIREESASADEAISTAIITGLSEIVAQHLQLIEQVAQLPSLWEAFLSRLEAYIDLEQHKMNAAAYRALSRVLAQITHSTKIWMGPLYRTLHLWLKRHPGMVEMDGKESNEEALAAYTEAASELYRLTQQSMSMSHIRTLLENLYVAIRNANGPGYGADTNNLSPLQAKAFDLLTKVHSDDPSTLIVVASKLATIAHDRAEQSPRSDGPTFVAVAHKATDWIRDLVLPNIANSDLLEAGVIAGVLENLRRLVEQKYTFSCEQRGEPLWRKATDVVIALLGPILQQCETQRLEQDVKISIWTEVVGIARAIVMANGLEFVHDRARVYEDETFDLDSFKALRTLIVPRLGDEDLPDGVRHIYTRALFEASIIHPTERDEVPRLGTSPLEDIDKIRRGRVKPMPCSLRERICYDCFAELIRMGSTADGSNEGRTLAQASAPLLVLRLAIPIKAYIADQPLRGRRPQPLSQLEELLFCFEEIKRLALESIGVSADTQTSSLPPMGAHLGHLYPLLVKAIGTAGDRLSGADEVLKPLQQVLEAITDGP